MSSCENWLSGTAKILLQLDSLNQYDRFELTLLSEGFMQIHREFTEILTKTCSFSQNMGWFMMVHDVLWWFMMIHDVS